MPNTPTTNRIIPSCYLTEIVTKEGAEVRLCSWLKQISCVEVSCQFRSDWTPTIEVYHVRKACEQVKVPALETIHFVAGTPPERRFRLADGAVGTTAVSR